MERIKKVHLNTFIEILLSLYNKGVDYIDITKMSSEEDKQDGVGISFTKEYMNKNMSDNFEEIEEMIDENMNLTDDDINDLL